MILETVLAAIGVTWVLFIVGAVGIRFLKFGRHAILENDSIRAFRRFRRGIRRGA